MKFLKFFKRCLILSLVLVLGIPLSLVVMLASANRASAAESLKTPVLEKIVLEENPRGQPDLVWGLPGAVTPQSIVEISALSSFSNLSGEIVAGSDGSFEKIILGDNVYSKYFLRSTAKGKVSNWVVLQNDISAPVLYSVGGFPKDRVYWPGEKIDLRLSFGEKNLKVSAEIGELDPSFPERISLSYLQDGTWRFNSPKLSGNLREGSHFIKVIAFDQAGNKLSENIRVVLKNIPVPEIISAKVDLNKIVSLNWQPVTLAQKYLLEWKVQGEETIEGQKIVDGSLHLAQIKVRQPGTFYEIKVSPVTSLGEIGPSGNIVVKTLGTSPIKTVAGQEAPAFQKQITPAIGGGVSTVSPKIPQVAQKPETPKEEVTPTETPKPEEQPQKEGWNRLLVALAILIIAAGAAIGGYYGYEWWAGKSKEDQPPAPPKSSNRW